MKMTPRQIVAQINAHCDKGNGIYVTLNGGTRRCFRAQLIKDLQGDLRAYVTPDFGDTWLCVTPTTTFIGGLPITGR